jgi:hypothetical protein
MAKLTAEEMATIRRLQSRMGRPLNIKPPRGGSHAALQDMMTRGMPHNYRPYLVDI